MEGKETKEQQQRIGKKVVKNLRTRIRRNSLLGEKRLSAAIFQPVYKVLKGMYRMNASQGIKSYKQ